MVRGLLDKFSNFSEVEAESVSFANKVKGDLFKSNPDLAVRFSESSQQNINPVLRDLQKWYGPVAEKEKRKRRQAENEEFLEIAKQVRKPVSLQASSKQTESESERESKRDSSVENEYLDEVVSRIEILGAKLKDPRFVRVTDRDNRSALQNASKTGNLMAAKLLLDHGASIDHKDNRGSTALHDAVSSGSASTLMFLLASGAQAQQDKEKKTPLDRAFEEMSKPAVSPLSDAPPKERWGNPARVLDALILNGLESEDLRVRSNALAAIANGRKNGQSAVPTFQANVNAVDGQRKNLLHKIVDPKTYSNSIEKQSIIQKLISLKVDLNARDSQGMTPLHIALSEGDLETAKTLVMNGADINMRTSWWPFSDKPIDKLKDQSKKQEFLKWMSDQGQKVVR
jgi:ankyrin repeat protein